MSSGWEHWDHPLLSDRWGLPLGAQGGVWILDDTWTHPLATTWYVVTGVWNRRSMLITENDVAVVVAQVQEERSALPGDFDTRPWAMPLQEREHMAVLLAQMGLTCHVLRGFVFEYAGLPVFRRDLSPVAGGAANSQ